MSLVAKELVGHIYGWQAEASRLCVESRARSDIAVRISGRDASGKPFAQSVVASSISSGGALLSGMEQQVRPGDLVLVEYEEKRARFRIVWVRESESERKTQAAIQRLENEQCPWVGF